MPITTGTRIGVYEITGTLGAGGMGEVYRARDGRLNRDVALKVLPDLFAADPDRLARFTREAQTLAALNHPNIAHIHGLEEFNGVRALAMELVEGEDLSDVIARGAMPLEDALPIATQIADALEAAHEQGIVHRDLKPANIKVRRDGTVKVLDFGLAKALDSHGGPEGQHEQMHSPTLTARATQMGMILGTAAYMAPEQARGKALDRRADIWAFGVILYEMLSGQRAFEGDDISLTLANVLKEDPKWSSLPPDLPSSVSRLLRRCLEKDPKRRLSAIGDARLELAEREAVAVTPASVTHVTPPRRTSMWSRVWPALAGALIVAAIGGAAWPRTITPPGARLARLAMLPPPGERLYPDSTGVAISPDGTMVVFVTGSVVRSETELWVRSLDSTVARRLDGGDGGNLPFWSPDSKKIAFFTSSKLKVVAASGGRAEVLCDAPGARGGAWSPSGVIVFAPDAGGPLFRISATGGTPEAVTAVDAGRKEFSHRFPSFLPDGVHFVYAVLPGRNGRFDILAGSLNDKTRTQIGSLEAAPVFSQGSLLYAKQGALAAVPFDPVALKVTGDPVVLDDEPGAILDPAKSFTAGTAVSTSSDGSLAYYSSPSLNTVATWYDATGVATGTLNVPPGHYETATISPDGSRAVLSKSTSPSESSLWVVDLARGGATPLSTGKGRNDSAVWSPDSTRVVWAADRDGTQNFLVKVVNDAAAETSLFSSEVPFKGPNTWSADGKSIIFTQLDPESSQNVWLLDASGTKPPTPLVRGPIRDYGGPVSPDGRWLAYTADDSGRFELFVQGFPSPGRKVQVSDEGAVGAWWSSDQRQLIFLGNDLRSLYRVDVLQGDTFRVGTPRKFATLPEDIIFVDAMPDRQRFLALAPERTGTGSVTVVQNWRSALK
jgi:Tol biopolymer transport system component